MLRNAAVVAVVAVAGGVALLVTLAFVVGCCCGRGVVGCLGYCWFLVVGCWLC